MTTTHRNVADVIITLIESSIVLEWTLPTVLQQPLLQDQLNSSNDHSILEDIIIFYFLRGVGGRGGDTTSSQIQTRDTWLGSANASSVLCRPPKM